MDHGHGKMAVATFDLKWNPQAPNFEFSHKNTGDKREKIGKTKMASSRTKLQRRIRMPKKFRDLKIESC